jgi:hypothetical protein
LANRAPHCIITNNMVKLNSFGKNQVLVLGCFLIFGTGALRSQSPALFGCPVFPSNNVWNAKVDQLPLAANSAAYVNTIGATKGSHADFGSGTYAGRTIGIPFTSVPGNQAKVPVSFTYASESDPGPYPIPANPPVEGGAQSTGDRHVLIVDRDQCVLYELFAAYPNTNGSWRAGSGARYDLRSNALRPAGWTSADAAGLPILPGLVRYAEVASGEIRHALRFTAPQTAAAYIWPARHLASSRTGSQYPPMGQRFRLKASFDISSFAPSVQVILRALKTYGMILADNGSSWYLSGESNESWNNTELGQFSRVHGSDFEAVDESSLRIFPDSGQVSGPPAASLALSAPVVMGGSTSAGNTVTLSTPDPAGASISLVSSNPAAASVPASITIGANLSAATFPIATSLVAVPTPVTITAYYLGNPTAATMRVDPGALTAVRSSSVSVIGPASLTGTASLSGGILGGASVYLVSSNPAVVSVPGTVSIPSGSLSATFPITVKAVTVRSPITLTATLGSLSRSTSISVDPAAVLVSTKTFQQGTAGYLGGKSLTISRKFAAAWNGFNGTTFRDTLEFAAFSDGVSTAALLRFDGIAVPAGMKVASATLTVKATSWIAGSLIVSYLKGPWDVDSTQLGWIKNSSLTIWGAPGASLAGTDILPGTVTVALRGSGEQSVVIPLDPNVVAGWLANPASNQGLRIEAVTEKSVTLHSVRNSAVEKRPILTINLQ